MGMTSAHNMISAYNQQREMLWKEICAGTKNYIQLSVTLFCFLNFGIDHGFSKQISFCTLCLKSIKQKKELVGFSNSLILMHRFLIA